MLIQHDSNVLVVGDGGVDLAAHPKRRHAVVVLLGRLGKRQR